MPHSVTNAGRLLDQVTVVLVRPRFPENIGAAARAAANMGLGRLALVADHSPDFEPVNKLASRLGQPMIDDMTIHPDLGAALAEHQMAVATTARLSSGAGRYRMMTHTPRTAALTILSLLPQNRVAMVFGPEDGGLTNDEIAVCQALVRIPTSSASSINLAQAVMILAYELFVAADDCFENFSPKTSSRLAVRSEIEGFYGHLRAFLIKIGAIKGKNPDYSLMAYRRFFDRTELRSHEVRLFRGILRRLDHTVLTRDDK